MTGLPPKPDEKELLVPELFVTLAYEACLVIEIAHRIAQFLTHRGKPMIMLVTYV